MINKEKHWIKDKIMNVTLSLVAAVIAYFAYTPIDASMAKMLSPIIFLLVIIYLEVIK